jgi:hypothetical protein
MCSEQGYETRENALIAVYLVHVGSIENLVRKTIATRIHDADLECQDGSYRRYTDGNGEHRRNIQRQYIEYLPVFLIAR